MSSKTRQNTNRPQDKRPSKTVHPVEAAFNVAVRLAAPAVKALVIHGEASETHDTDISTVYNALIARRPYADPLKTLQDLIETLAANRNQSCEMSDLAGSVFVDASESGYAYGLAVGLALAKMGNP